MRRFVSPILMNVALLVVFGHSDARSQNISLPSEETIAVEWHFALSPNSSARHSDHMTVIAVTNDDPFLARLPNANQADSEDATAFVFPAFANEIAAAYREAVTTRKDWRERLDLQWMPCGLPRELTSGEASGGASRVFVMVCDSENRTLALTVGVPTAKQLVALIEDAEEVQRLLPKTPDNQMHLSDAVVARSHDRLSRVWRVALDAAATNRGANDGDSTDDEDVSEQFVFYETFKVCQKLLPTYIADVRLRFGLDDESDLPKLAILEHHCQTRRPWSEAITPFVVGQHTRQVSSALVESIWGHPAIRSFPVHNDADFERFADWVSRQTSDTTVVLSLKPPASRRYQVWPPIASDQSPRTSKWRETHELATAQPHRLVDLQILAHLIRENELAPVDVRGVNVRYAMLFPNRNSIHLVRENESPARFAGMLKRNRSHLVNKK
ncbi:hypothetical protein Pla22_15540 [Rubripirellula amarantea]|uniref:Uncharacterized protein n=1 Tax=Rubripirellula amarantea TaxID=2527999 RepID=A0A5C5WTS2_9BACT|nr:hypothetical protein [Rubripirellula amarantea]TWT53920.1 hypothetical protein Pla22_15540 [Rubripirellula amarantea]